MLLKEGNDKFIDWKLVRVMKTYESDDEHISVIDIKTSTGMLHRNVNRVVTLPFYDDIGPPSNVGRDVPANSLNSYSANTCPVELPTSELKRSNILF